MIRFLKWVFNFHDQRRQLLLLILIAFLATFFIARFISLRFGPTIFINGYHIHHFYFGMIVLSAGAITGVLSVGKKASRVGSVLIGLVLGLIGRVRTTRQSGFLRRPLPPGLSRAGQSI